MFVGVFGGMFFTTYPPKVKNSDINHNALLSLHEILKVTYVVSGMKCFWLILFRTVQWENAVGRAPNLRLFYMDNYFRGV